MKQIPNFITLCNLLAGSLSIYAATQGNMLWAAYFIFFGAIADFFDGLVARAMGVSSPVGAQLDSLSDLVSFGLAPAFIALHFFQDALQFQFLAFLIPLCAAIRLARFNVGKGGDETYFYGLPSPACGMFWAFTAIGGIHFLPQEMQSIYVGLCILGTALLMVVPLRILSFKLKSLSWRANASRYLFLILALIIIPFAGWASPPIILVLYLFCSIADKYYSPKAL
ncbi:MAG: CDP-alcohol phosphatidyltransferase family protein [Luteibaculum sp.]